MSSFHRNRPAGAKTALGLLLRIFATAAVVFGLAMTVIVNFQILVRYVPFMSAPWTEETARFLWIWAIALMSGPCYLYGDYVAIEIVSTIMPERLWRSLLRLGHAIVAGLSGVIAAYGFILAFSTTNQLSSALRLNMGLVNASMGFLGANIAIAALYRLIGGTAAALVGMGAETTENGR